MLINGKKTTIHKGLSFSFDDDGITYSGNKNKTTVNRQLKLHSRVLLLKTLKKPIYFITGLQCTQRLIRAEGSYNCPRNENSVIFG